MSLIQSSAPLATSTLKVLATTSVRPIFLGTAHLVARNGLISTSVRYRAFSTTPVKPLSTSKPFFNPNFVSKLAKKEKNGAAFKEETFPHPIYTKEQMDAIKIAHRHAKTWSDWLALGAVRTLRWTFDKATGYTHDHALATGSKSVTDTKPMFQMNADKWLIRFIFLESVAGVFGMVGGMVRHLHSLRRLKRDMGWIETLLDEAYNERMHLLTFLKLKKPGIFMRLSILGAQGVVFNGFFLAYLLSPRTCHRFVGYLEEEAVITYTRAIKDIESGKIPEWQTLAAPDIAKKYWNMDENASMVDLLYYIRADEAKHREVNHTLANLEQNLDPNPYKKIDGVEVPKDKAIPTKSLEHHKETGWEREEALAVYSGKSIYN